MTLKRDTKFGEESTCCFKIGIRNFYKFWPEHFKGSKMFTLMGSFWGNYVLFELKKYRGVIFDDIEEWYKIWRKTNMWFGKWQEFGKFSPEHSKESKLGLWWDPFVKSWKCMTLKFTEELCVMTMKNDTKIEEDWLVVLKLTWGISWILTQALKNRKKLCCNWLIVTKVYNVWATIVQRSHLSWHWRVVLNFKKNWLVVWNMTWEICKFPPEHLEVSKLGLSWDPFVQNRKGMTLKITEEIYIMAMKNNAQFEEK